MWLCITQLVTEYVYTRYSSESTLDFYETDDRVTPKRPTVDRNTVGSRGSAGIEPLQQPDRGLVVARGVEVQTVGGQALRGAVSAGSGEFGQVLHLHPVAIGGHRNGEFVDVTVHICNPLILWSNVTHPDNCRTGALELVERCCQSARVLLVPGLVVRHGRDSPSSGIGEVLCVIGPHGEHQCSGREVTCQFCQPAGPIEVVGSGEACAVLADGPHDYRLITRTAVSRAAHGDTESERDAVPRHGHLPRVLTGCCGHRRRCIGAPATTAQDGECGHRRDSERPREESRSGPCHVNMLVSGATLHNSYP